MISIILYGGSVEGRAGEVATRYPSNQFLIIHISPEKTSILISQIHSLIKDLSITSHRDRLVWIEEADKMTNPAQNALLKALEEPGPNTQFVLTLSSPEALVATIRSRCRLLRISSPALALDGTGLADIKRALPLSFGDRILAADAIGRKREVVLAWTSKCLSDLDVKMKTEKSLKSLEILGKISTVVHATHLDLQSNVAVALTMQNLFLNLPRTKN